VPPSRPSREIKARWRQFFALAPIVALVPLSAVAATPSPPPASASPHPANTRPPHGPVRVEVTKVPPKSALPKHAEHTEYVVEINKLGQVARVASGRTSDSPSFNAETYGNALQAFIRTPDGHVVVGTYRLTYDFDPKTGRVRRDVTLVRQGGVDPDAKGAAIDLLEKAHVPTDLGAGAGANVDPNSLPDLRGVLEPSPSSTPAPTPSPR
jgi:hypothetical protein